jgi:hypothetical protein
MMDALGTDTAYIDTLNTDARGNAGQDPSNRTQFFFLQRDEKPITARAMAK